MLGFSAEEMIGNPSVLDLLVPDPAYRTSMAAEWAGKGDHRDWEWEHTTKDGRELTIAWSNISESFPVQGWATWGIGVDLTERTRALELLQTARRELEDRVAERTVELQGVLDNIADGVVAISESGTIESFNPAAEKIFGYTAREATGKTVGILLPDSEHSQRNGDVTTYVDTGNGGILGAGSREVTARRKDGSSFPMELSVGELELGDRRVFVCAMRDISERKRADAEIRESQEMLSGFMASATDNFMILDHDLNILDLNENAARRRGQSRDNLIGRNLADVVRDSVSFGRFEAFKKVLITGRPHHFEAGVVRSGQDVQRARHSELERTEWVLRPMTSPTAFWPSALSGTRKPRSGGIKKCSRVSWMRQAKVLRFLIKTCYSLISTGKAPKILAYQNLKSLDAHISKSWKYRAARIWPG